MGRGLEFFHYRAGIIWLGVLNKGSRVKQSSGCPVIMIIGLNFLAGGHAVFSPQQKTPPFYRRQTCLAWDVFEFRI